MDNNFEWPWQYEFPPFFTLQVHSETRDKQLNAWRSLVLQWCSAHKVYRINLDEKPPFFQNATIERTLDADGTDAVMRHLEAAGNAQPLDKARRSWLIFWLTLDEWASYLYKEILTKDTVLTIYELINGDDYQHADFHGMDADVMINVLKLLEEQGKCELIMDGNIVDTSGVKFF